MSDRTDSSDDETEKKIPTNSSDSDASTRKKRASRSTMKTIECGGSSDSDSDDGRHKKHKKEAKKRTGSKRKRNNSGSSDDARVDDSLFVDAEDKARWKGLSELEKEQEIFERMEARENQRAREEIAQQLKAKKEREGRKAEKRKKISNSSDSERSASPRKKSSGSDSEMDAEFHQPSDISRKHKEKNAMAELKQKRKEIEKKNARSAALSIDAVFGAESDESSSSSSSSASSRSSSRSSSRDSSPDGRYNEEEKVVKKEVDSLAELKRARLSRFKLCKLLHAPFFAETVVGCYVRVGMGFMGGSESKYKLWQIISVEETNKVYDVDGKRTNKGLKCKHGKTERVFRIAYVSNSEFLNTEFDEWLNSARESFLIPTMDIIEKKEMEIKKAIEHKYSDKEVDAMIKEKSRFQKVPRNIAMTKADMAKRKEIAQQCGDFREADKIQREIDDLERHADNLDKKRSQAISNIAFINYRNRTKNKNEILSGQFKMEATSQDDPFTRKKGGMKVVSGSKAKGDGIISASSSQINLVEMEKESSISSVKSVKTLTIKDRRKSANMFDLHNSAGNFIDLNIDIDKLSSKGRDEIDLATNGPQPVVPGSDGKSKGLSLADYRRRKAEVTATSTE